MKNAILIISLLFSLNSFSQSLFGLESEYTPQFGYRYFFDKIDASTGAVTQLAQLPVINYFSQTYTPNCRGNYVFTAIDSTTANPYHFNFYEIDTFGIIQSVVPADTGTSGHYQYLRETFDGTRYVGLHLNTFGPWELQMVSVDKNTGDRTINGTFVGSVFTSQIGSYADTPTSDNILWMGGYGQTPNGNYGYLYKTDLDNGTIELIDSAYNSYYVNMYYDCELDRMYGFKINQGTFSLSGAEYFEIDLTTDQVIYPGITISGAGGSAVGWTGLVLPDGKYLIKTGGTISTFDQIVTGPTYTPSSAPAPTVDVRQWMGPKKTCAIQADCSENVGLAKTETNELLIYPSPNATGNFLFTQPVSGEYTVVDIHGRLVQDGNLDEQKKLTLNNELSGVYFITLTMNSSTQRFKVIVE